LLRPQPPNPAPRSFAQIWLPLGPIRSSSCRAQVLTSFSKCCGRMGPSQTLRAGVSFTRRRTCCSNGCGLTECLRTLSSDGLTHPSTKASRRRSIFHDLTRSWETFGCLENSKTGLSSEKRHGNRRRDEDVQPWHPADGSQPFRSVPIRSSVAAGSRR